MKQKWFWGTLLLWMVLTGAVISWALISSPLKFDPQTISKSETKVNGQVQKTELWVNQGRLTDLAPLITKEWTNDNWKPFNNGIDLTPALLGPLSDSFDLSDQIQIKLFEKNGLYRALGLWQSKTIEATYGMTSEIPRTVFDSSQGRSNWGFPISLPTNAYQIFYEKLNGLEIGFFALPSDAESLQQFDRTCVSQGFTETLWRKESDKNIYLLSKKKLRILAILSSEDKQSHVSLVSIKN